jgi:hypothetical protein
MIGCDRVQLQLRTEHFMHREPTLHFFPSFIYIVYPHLPVMHNNNTLQLIAGYKKNEENI